METTVADVTNTSCVSHNELDNWLNIALQCKYLPEPDMKKIM